MDSAVLVVAAHPDDDVLGCGGTMAKLAANGATVHVAFLADGVSARGASSKVDSNALKRRREAGARACALLGAEPPVYGDFPDNQMDSIPLLSVTQAVEDLISKIQPGLIFTHHAGDVNIDHRIVHQAVVTACRPQIGLSVRTLLFFEVASSTEWQPPSSAPVFAPNWFEDITPFLQTKLDAMAAYEEELRDWPHPRSLKGITSLSNWRGGSIGVDAAEAFILGRKLT